MKLLTERLKKREEERDKEDPDERGREHAREGCDADGPTARGARPCREHQRQDAEEEAPGRHHHRAEADGGPTSQESEPRAESGTILPSEDVVGISSSERFDPRYFESACTMTS